ncbi:hypothetical protein DFH06DRAFT_1123724 [Mycena polygramma]|nr:hypothetical protein DFH06DRAFT_1123724 [Mycena polygramma]
MASSTAPPSPPSDADSSDGESIGDLDVTPWFVFRNRFTRSAAFACGEDIPTFAAASLWTAIKYLARVDAFNLHFYEDDDHSLRQVATVWFNLDGVLTDQCHPARWYTAYPTFWQAKDSTRGILAGKYSDPIDENYAFGQNEAGTYGTPRRSCMVGSDLPYVVHNLYFNPRFRHLFRLSESKRVGQIGPLWFQIVFGHPNEWQVTSYIAEAEQLSRLPGACQIFRVFPDESAAQGPRSTSTQLAICSAPRYFSGKVYVVRVRREQRMTLVISRNLDSHRKVATRDRDSPFRLMRSALLPEQSSATCRTMKASKWLSFCGGQAFDSVSVRFFRARRSRPRGERQPHAVGPAASGRPRAQRSGSGVTPAVRFNFASEEKNGPAAAEKASGSENLAERKRPRASGKGSASEEGGGLGEAIPPEQTGKCDA